MKKATKGALAAAAAGSLLLGGAGSLAYWTDTGTVGGASIISGHLKLTQGTACDTTWILNATDPYASQVLSPGDTLSRHCSYTVAMSGDNLSADLAISAPGFASGPTALRNDLTLTPTYTYDADGAGVGAAVPVVGGAVTGLVNGAVIDTTINVVFKDVASINNTSNTGTDLTAALSDITVTATQS